MSYNFTEMDAELANNLQWLEYQKISGEPAPSAQKKALNFFKTSTAKICNGFQTAKTKVKEFANSDTTKKVLNTAKKVAVIAALFAAGFGLAAGAGALIGVTFAATVINPVCIVLVPPALLAAGATMLISRYILLEAVRNVATF